MSSIVFCHPEDVAFDIAKARELVKSIAQVQKDWQVEGRKVVYYYANSAQDIDNIRGFDFVMGRNSKPSGIAYEDDNVVYCVGLGENYFHEIVHVYLGFLPNKELQEGLAIFYGGSMGNSLNEQLSEAKLFLHANPSFSFDKGNLNESVMANGVNMSKFYEAIICKEIYNKNGLQGLKRAMNFKTLKDALKAELGIEPKDYDSYFKQMILADK